jgi:hypothetical protein
MTILNCAVFNLFVPYCKVIGLGLLCYSSGSFCKYNDH